MGFLRVNYLDSLMVVLHDFQLEVEWNIQYSSSVYVALEYVSRLNTQFRTLYKLSEYSFEIELFPNVLEEKKIKIKNTHTKVTSFVITQTMTMLKDRMKILKIGVKNPESLISHNQEQTKYMWNGDASSCIELGYAINLTNKAIKKNGEQPTYTQFVSDFCSFLGKDVKNTIKLKELS